MICNKIKKPRCGFQTVDKLRFNFVAAFTPHFVFPLTRAAEKLIVSEKPLFQRFFKVAGVVLAELNNRLPPVAGKRRLLWRRGQRKFALQAIIFFGYRKSKECSPKIFDFRANGIPTGERVDFFDTLKAALRLFYFTSTELS